MAFQHRFTRVVLWLGLAANLSFAQAAPKLLDVNRHGWFSYSGDHPFAGRWGVHFDAQWRRADILADWQQYQIRPGLNFQLAPDILLTAGYAYTRTYPYGEFPATAAFPEHRIYQQLLVTDRRTGVTLQHRTRLEQRFIRYPNTDTRSWTYQNRIRYLLRAELPLAKDEGGTTSWYLPAYDEILIGIPPNYGARLFDQNRLFVGLGRAVGPVKMEAGYLNQFIGQRNGRIFEMNNTFFVTVTSTASLSSLFGD